MKTDGVEGALTQLGLQLVGYGSRPLRILCLSYTRQLHRRDVRPPQTPDRGMSSRPQDTLDHSQLPVMSHA